MAAAAAATDVSSFAADASAAVAEVGSTDPKALHEVLDRSARHAPFTPAIVDDEGTLTYAELQSESAALAEALLRRGVEPLTSRPLATYLRRGRRLVVAYAAAMRCGAPVLALSGDLRDASVELERNQDALRVLSAQLLLVKADEGLPGLAGVRAAADAAAVPVAELSALAQPSRPPSPIPPADSPAALPIVGEDALLAYCFTGGTTRASKAVRISHAMALHEARRYREVLPPELGGTGMRFLQNSSAYWGAALLGQLDVPFAVGGAAVICQADLPAEIVDAVNRFGITCFGAVPSVLAHFGPEDVPRVRCVISWAEELTDAVAERWHPHVALRDLLIATEYWLCLYSTREHGRWLRPVAGVRVLVVDPDGDTPVGNDEVGELLLGGPTVCPGYADSALDDGRFVRVGAHMYFRTRDLVRPVRGTAQLEYCGRCDDMVKVGGKWVDVTAVEARVLMIPGVKEAKLVFGSDRHHAFLVLRQDFAQCPKAKATGMGSGVIDAVRQQLPPQFSIHVIAADALPRHAATGKVDRRMLLDSVQERPLSAVLRSPRSRVVSRLARAYRAAARYCVYDPRRMVALAYMWYAIYFCAETSEVDRVLAKSFALQGGTASVLLGLAKVLPLPQLQRLAVAGASHARAAGRGLDWVVVFWTGLPYWLHAWDRRTKPCGAWAQNSKRAAGYAVNDLQAWAAGKLQRGCPSCAQYAVTLIPSLTHCCDSCAASGGQKHDAACFRQPRHGRRRCDNCEFATTWDSRFCCYACEKSPGNHGPRCDKLCMTSAEATVAPPAAPGAKGAAAADAARSVEPPRSRVAPVAAAASAVARSRAAAAAVGAAVEAPGAALGERVREKAEKDVDGLEAGAAGAEAVSEREVRALWERVTGSAAPGEAEALPPLDSLRALRLVAAVHQDMRRSIRVQDLHSCGSAAALAALIARAPALPAQTAAAPERFRLWTFGWNLCLQWLFTCEISLELEGLRLALPRLMERHPALRLRPGERLAVQQSFMEAGAVFELVRASLPRPPLLPKMWSVITAARDALPAAWPCWRLAPVPASGDQLSEVLFEVECAEMDVESVLRRLRKEFVPPFQLVLLRHPGPDGGEGGAPLCHLLVMMSHAIADGSAIVPFLQDLGELFLNGSGNPLEGRRLKRLPHFGAILDDRLVRTLRGDKTKDDYMFLDRRQDFFDHHFPERRYIGYTQVFHVVGGELRKLRAAIDAHVPGCSAEVALLAMVVISLARVENSPRVKFTLVHHARDYPPGAADVIGFFTDFRNLEVPTSPLASLLGVVVEVASAVRARRWRPPEMLEPTDVLVNVVPSPFDRVGHFTQARCLGSAPGSSGSWPADGSLWQGQRNRSHRKKLEFQIEQVDAEEWNVSMYPDAVSFPTAQGERFRTCWLGALDDLCEDPLRPVLLPHAPTADDSAVAATAPGKGDAGAGGGRGGVQPTSAGGADVGGSATNGSTDAAAGVADGGCAAQVGHAPVVGVPAPGADASATGAAAPRAGRAQDACERQALPPGGPPVPKPQRPPPP